MKRITLATVILASGVVLTAAQAFAQDAPGSEAPDAQPLTGARDIARPPDFQLGEINFGVAGRDDPQSSRFNEYRDVIKGISVPGFRFLGSNNGVRFDLRGENVTQDDERYAGFVKNAWFALNADYNSIIHRIGNNGHTMLTQVSPGVWRMSPALQQSFQNTWESTPTASRVFTTFVAPLFAPSIADGTVVDVAVHRERTNIVLDLARNQPFSAKVNYTREQRHGSGGLSSNYLSYQTETPTVTEYLTQDVGINTAVEKPWGSVRAGLHYNWFDDQVPALQFDSPFRATDAASATVTLEGGASSVGGPTSGLMVNPPSNTAMAGGLGTTLKLPGRTRVTADVNLGQWKQNEGFFPYLTNTTVLTTAGLPASSTSSLPAQSLNGKIGSTSSAFALTSRPIDPLRFNLRYRRYDLNNETPRIAFPGYGSWDRTWSGTGRESVPYGYTSNRLDAGTDYEVGIVTFEGAYRRTTMDRSFRETDQTTENAGSFATVVHVADMANLRGSYERASRGYSGLDLARSEDASFVIEPTGLSANVLGRDGNLRFDQSDRISDRAGLDLDMSAGSKTTIFLQYLHNKDTYKNTAHGLQNASYDTYTAEVDVAPAEQYNFSAYYTREQNGSSQINNGTSNFPTIDDFTIRLLDKVNTAGATVAVTVVPSKATFNVGGRYQNLIGTAGFTTNPNSTYQLARAAYGGVKDIPNADNAKIVRVESSLDYVITAKVTFTMGAWHEKYVFSDVDSVGLQNLYPGAFFLALNDGSYSATVGYLRLHYHW